MAVQKDASHKNERNLQENYEDIIFVENQANTMEKHRKKKVTNTRRMKKSICAKKIAYDDSSWDSSLFCTRGTRSLYCHHL